MGGGFAVLSRDPWSQPARAGIVLQLLHGRASDPPRVEPTPIVWGDDELIDRALAVFELAIASLDPLRLQTFGAEVGQDSRWQARRPPARGLSARHLPKRLAWARPEADHSLGHEATAKRCRPWRAGTMDRG